MEVSKGILTTIIYLGLTIACIFVCSIKVSDYLTYPTQSKVTQEIMDSEDIPFFVICPQPSLNLSALEGLENTKDMCKTKGCSFIDTFGSIVEGNNFKSKEVANLYENLKLSAFEVIANARAHFSDKSHIDLKQELSKLPNGELGDCLVYSVPTGHVHVTAVE